VKKERAESIKVQIEKIEKSKKSWIPDQARNEIGKEKTQKAYSA